MNASVGEAHLKVVGEVAVRPNAGQAKCRLKFITVVKVISMTAKAVPSSSKKVVLVEEAMKVVQLPTVAPIVVKVLVEVKAT